MSVQAEIERFIIDDLMHEPVSGLDPDQPLFAGGIIDSMGMLQLITFLEERYGLTIGDGEVGEENIGTLARLAAFVERKQSETADRE